MIVAAILTVTSHLPPPSAFGQEDKVIEGDMQQPISERWSLYRASHKVRIIGSIQIYSGVLYVYPEQFMPVFVINLFKLEIMIKKKIFFYFYKYILFFYS